MTIHSQAPADTLQENRLMLPGLGSAIALTQFTQSTIAAFTAGTAAMAIGPRIFSRFLRGYGFVSIVGTTISNSARVVAGTFSNDRTVAGDGVAGLSGAAAGAGLAGAGLAAAAAFAAPVSLPIALAVVGGTMAVGSTSGHVLRDASREFRHLTDDVIAHDMIIQNIPEGLKKPGSEFVQNVARTGREFGEFIGDHTPQWLKNFDTQVTHPFNLSGPATPAQTPARTTAQANTSHNIL